MTDQAVRTTTIIIIGMIGAVTLVFLIGQAFSEPPDGQILEPTGKVDQQPR